VDGQPVDLDLFAVEPVEQRPQRPDATMAGDLQKVNAELPSPRPPARPPSAVPILENNDA
jgi:hypothetical protein